MSSVIQFKLVKGLRRRIDMKFLIILRQEENL